MDPKMSAVDASNFLDITIQAVHKRLKVKNLAFKKSQNRVYFGFDTAKELFQINFSNKIIAFQIVKGGVGKTELAFSSSVRANLYGARVLCIDLDQQSNLTKAFRINAQDTPVMVDIINENLPIEEAIVNVIPGLDLLPSRVENAVLDNVLMLGRFPLDRVYKDRFQPLKQKYDFILIDCPPALTQSVTAVALAADEIIAPVTPDEFGLDGLAISSQELSNLEKNYHTKINLKIALNKFDTRNSLSHETLATLLKDERYTDKVFKGYVRSSQDFPKAVKNNQSVFDSLRNLDSKEDIDIFTRELLGISCSMPTANN